MDIGASGQGEHQARVVRESTSELANVTIRLSKHVPGAENTDHTSANCRYFDKTCRKCGNVGHLASVCVDLLELLSPRPRVVRRANEAKVAKVLSRLVGIVVRADTCRRSVPRRRSMRWNNPPLQVRLAVKTQSWLDRSGATSMLAA